MCVGVVAIVVWTRVVCVGNFLHDVIGLNCIIFAETLVRADRVAAVVGLVEDFFLFVGSAIGAEQLAKLVEVHFSFRWVLGRLVDEGILVL